MPKFGLGISFVISDVRLRQRRSFLRKRMTKRKIRSKIMGKNFFRKRLPSNGALLFSPLLAADKAARTACLLADN